ncbi:MAG: SDR family oxidoreductase [Blastocatellia bacterium]|nr:SDR family oxidoreductase [Blastocatellia bacterium]
MRKETAESRKTALITGASSGIGYELAGLFAKSGHDLVIVARNEQRLDSLAVELAQRFGINVTVLAKDLSAPTAAEEILAELRHRALHIDILVNNAGFGAYGAFQETGLERELQMIQVNITALTQLTKLILPEMLKRNSGKILNIGSTASFAPSPFVAVYGATKAYVLSFSEALAEELKGTGVTVTVLCPGSTETEFAERAKMTESRLFQGRLMNAGEVAEIGFRALMEGKTTVIAGIANKLLVFSQRFAPRKMVAAISRKLLERKERLRLQDANIKA